MWYAKIPPTLIPRDSAKTAGSPSKSFAPHAFEKSCRRPRYHFVDQPCWFPDSSAVLKPVSDQEDFRETLHREATIDEIKINPLIFSATVRGFKLADPGGPCIVAAFQELLVNVDVPHDLHLSAGAHSGGDQAESALHRHHPESGRNL